MVDPTSPLLLLRRSLAQLLEDNGHGVYNADGAVYAAGVRGIYTNGPTLPTITGSDNCIVLTSFPSVSEGRANLIHRIQIYGRVKGNSIAAENLEQAIFADLDHAEGTPPGHHISWTWRFSTLMFEADASGRSAFVSTYYLRGRR